MSAERQKVTREFASRSANGYVMGLLGLVFLGTGGVLLGAGAGPAQGAAAGALLLLAVLTLKGIYMLQPKQGALMLLFGEYRGTDVTGGLRWTNPFYGKTKISLRARNLNTDKIKVNDKRGNPIEIGAAIVWRVSDTARASYDVENYEEYVRVQSDAALRHLASSYVYDEGDADEGPQVTLRGGMQDVTASLNSELQERLYQAGIVVEDARLTHLAYAPEIAGVMLRRQQAEAVVAARQKIVVGAVSMVEMALKGLSERKVVDLDDERKASMVSNLLVVLCSESDAQPIINAGTLYN